MKGNKTKIEITRSPELHFVDIYIPKNEFLDGPELSILHHEEYLHIMFPTNDNPSYIFKPCPPEKRPLEEILWGEYDLEDFMRREFET